jgi:thiol:disulfide interchange protein DsbA
LDRTSLFGTSQNNNQDFDKKNMNMRHPYCILLQHLAFLLFSILIMASTVQAHDGHDHAKVSNFIEGKHYHKISPAVPTNVGEGKVEVLELFWYGCPHCFEFEPHIEAWQETKPSYVSFLRMPAVLNRGWVAHARAFYALEAMGELERIHPIFFEAIHVQGRRLRDAESMSRFLSQHDVDVVKFKNAYDSMYVDTKIKRSGQLAQQYGASSVPQVIINGKYRTSASDAGGYENLIHVVNMLAEQESNSVEELASGAESTE